MTSVRRLNVVNDLIKVDYTKEEPTVSAKEVHRFLGVGTHFKDWFPRMCEYGFVQDVDFCSFLSESTGGRPSRDYQLTIPMAKEICMIQRTEKGKMARQYFISLEKAWNTPEMVMSRALRMADSKILYLQTENSRLLVEKARMQPKADYFDELVDRNLLANFRDTAKELKIGEKVFIGFLLEKKYIYRDGKGKIKPFADRNNGLFEIKETKNDKTGWVGTQTLITPKGRETFRLLLIDLKGVSA
jgi:phage antirepressor YoqD-like protein/phage anti-repressor protein